ncbi:MAG: hypothetical protein ABI607_16205, partial [Betaproteobacteria bacterium]
SDPTGLDSLFEFTLGRALDTAIEQAYSIGNLVVQGCSLKQRLDVIGQTVLWGGLAAAAAGVAIQAGGLPGKTGFTLVGYNPAPTSPRSPRKVDFTLEFPLNAKLGITQANGTKRDFAYGVNGVAIGIAPPPIPLHQFEMCGVPVGGLDFKAKISLGAGKVTSLGVAFSVELNALSTFKFEYPLFSEFLSEKDAGFSFLGIRP